MILAETFVVTVAAFESLLFGLAAVITPIGVIIGVVYAKRSSKDAKEVNDAVNNVHAVGGERIYDMVLENRKMTKAGFDCVSRSQDDINMRLDMNEIQARGSHEVLKAMWRKVFNDDDYPEVTRPLHEREPSSRQESETS